MCAEIVGAIEYAVGAGVGVVVVVAVVVLVENLFGSSLNSPSTGPPLIVWKDSS